MWPILSIALKVTQRPDQSSFSMIADGGVGDPAVATLVAGVGTGHVAAVLRIQLGRLNDVGPVPYASLALPTLTRKRLSFLM